MAQQLSKTNIAQNETIQAWQVSQSVDAFTGIQAYDIIISGSLTLTGSVQSQQGYTGSLYGNAFSATSASTALSSSYAFNATSASVAITASYARTASYATTFTIATNLTASGLKYPTVDGLSNQVLETDGAGNLTFDDVHTMLEEVYAGENLTKGDPLYISGSQGAMPKVYKAAAGDPAKMPVTYIALETVGANTATRGIILGLIEGMNLTGFEAGTEVFVSPTGGWTATRPTGSSIVQVLGYVTKGGSGGKGLVLNPGPATLPNITSGNVWIGNSNSVPTAQTTASIMGSGSYGVAYPSGAIAPIPSSPFRFIAGASKTGTAPNTSSITVNELTTKIYGQTFFVTATTAEPVNAGSISLQTPVLAPNLIFVTENPNTDFTYQIMYI